VLVLKYLWWLSHTNTGCSNKRGFGFTNSGCDDDWTVVQQGYPIVMRLAFLWFPANTRTSTADSLLYHVPRSESRMSQDLNFFTTTSRNSSSSNYTNSLNAGRSFNNTNCFNNSTTNNVSNHFTVTEDRSEILAWLSPLEPRLRHQNLEAGRVDKVGDSLLQTEQFRSWLDRNSQGDNQNATIFCHGQSGGWKDVYLVGDTAPKRRNADKDFVSNKFPLQFSSSRYPM